MTAIYNSLLYKTTTCESISFYYRGIGDNFRVQMTILTGVDQMIAMKQSGEAYNLAIKAADRLPVLNIVKLGLMINYATLYEGTNLKRSVEIAKSTWDEIVRDQSAFDTICENEYKEVTILTSLLRDNLTYWVEKAN